MLGRSWLAAALLAAAPAGAAERAAAAPAGVWWAEGGAAQVEITECGDALCGRVVWLRAPFDPNGCAVRDDQNPDPTLRTRSLVGLPILRDLRPSASEPNVWTGGEIYDPTLGRTFRARLELLDRGRLALRGYLGFELLGRTTTWIRVGATPVCAATDTGGGADPDPGAMLGGACRHPES